MDDDDEFGDLYTDVLRTFSESHPSIVSPTSTTSPKPNLNHQTNDDNPDDPTNPNPTNLDRTPIPKVEKPENEGSSTGFGLDEVNRESVEVKKEEEEEEEEDCGGLGTRDEELGGGVGRVCDGGVKDEIFIKEEVEFDLDGDDLGNLGSEPMIPGISGGVLAVEGLDLAMGGGEDAEDARMEGGEEGGGEEWDSDSEDDLQIVLNDKSGPVDMDMNEGMGTHEEDGENFFTDQQQQQQPNVESEWGGDALQGVDGDRKEAVESGKVNDGLVSSVPTRVGFGNQMYPANHSQFKYVRPGAPLVPGGAIVGPGNAPGQVRPLVNIGSVGRGRGDWRPTGIKTTPGMPRPLHSGFGLPPWGNNSAGRGFGSGLDFTLPSHKTVLDIDIDIFEDKPWRNPGVDVSDFFNFGLNEESWRDYCKRLEQLRLEATMQTRIRVYESERSEQVYDPDMPPELAVATGIQDTSAQNANLTKVDGGFTDMTGQGGGASRIRPPTIPTGRAIQVESGYGERLPSTDTRQQRMRDSDAVIEIVLQGSGDDEPEADDDMGRRESFTGSANNISEGDGLQPFPPEGRAPNYSDGSFGTPHDRRWSQETTRDRCSRQTLTRCNDAIACDSVHLDNIHDSARDKSGESIDGEKHQGATSLNAVEVTKKPSRAKNVDLHDGLKLHGSVALDEEIAVDGIIPSDIDCNGSPFPSTKRKKMGSRVEQHIVQDMGIEDGLRATHSSDNSKVRSGSSIDYLKQRDGGEEEVVQEGRSRRIGDRKRHHDENDLGFQRKDDRIRDGRLEMDRSRVFAKGREDPHVSYPYRNWDLNQTHLLHVRTGDNERLRERDNSVGARQRRDSDTHGKRLKDEDIRKMEYVDEIGYRQRSRVHESEKSDKDEHLRSRMRLDNGDWRGHHVKDLGPRQRENDEILMIRHANFDDSHTRRRKEEELLRREQAEKDNLYGYRAREDTTRRKRDRDDGFDHRRREEQHRVRDKLDDNHCVDPREESWRQRDKDERRLKQTHEKMLANREREGRSSVRSGRDIEDKSWIGSTKVKPEPKGLGSDKDYPYKDKRHPSEHTKRSDRVEDVVFSQHRGRENVYARGNHLVNEDRKPRYERLSVHHDHPVNVSESQLIQKERHKERRRSKESDMEDQNTLVSSKRRQEDYNAYRTEKVSSNVAIEQKAGNVQSSGQSSNRDLGKLTLPSSVALSKNSSHEDDPPQHRHSSRKLREDAALDDEQLNLRRGRSKFERWNSNKDRDAAIHSLPASSKSKEITKDNIDPSLEVSEQTDGQNGTAGSVEDENTFVEERKDADTEPTPGGRVVESDKVGDGRHLDTVAKLKKRSERFNTPMPIEVDTTAYRKVETEVLVPDQTDAAADAEVKPERPARKRRWISS